MMRRDTSFNSKTEWTAFSSNPVDSSMFDVPAGFRKVDHELKRAGQ